MEFSMNIEEQDISFAKAVCEEYKDEQQKNKAFVSALGTAAFKNYLKDCDVKVEDDSLFRIKKIYELTDISDVFANGNCVDVRTYTISDALYIPKRHFEEEITPKYYVLALYNEEKKEIIFKGYIPSNNIDKTNQSENYYVTDSSNLLPMEELIQAILAEEPQEQTINSEELSGLFAAFLDNELEEEQKLGVIKLLYNCTQGRKDIIDFSQFEFLSSNLSNFPTLFEEQETYEDNDDNVLENTQNTDDEELLESDDLPLFEEDDDLEFIEAEEENLLEDSESEETENIENTEEQDNSSDSSFSQTLAATGMAGAAFAAGAAIGAAATELTNTTEGIADVTSSTIDAVGDAVGALDNLIDDNTTNSNNEDFLSLQEETDFQQNIAEDEEMQTLEDSDSSDDDFINLDDDVELLEEDNSENNIEESDEDITFDLDDEENFEEQNESEENIIQEPADSDFTFEENTEDLLTDEENDFEYSVNDEDNTIEISENSEEDFSDQDNNDDKISEDDIEDLSNIDDLSFEDDSIPEIIESNDQEDFEIPTEPQIIENEPSENKENEYDYSDINSLLDELQVGNENNENNISEDYTTEDVQIENENIETLYEQAPDSSENTDELNAEEYAKYVEAPSVNTKKNIVVPVVLIATAASLMACGGYLVSNRLSQKFSNTITSYNQQPTSEIQMKSVDDFDDETFLEKSEMELLSNTENNGTGVDMAQNPDSQIPSDLNQSISNIFDETVYPVTISKIAWEIPEVYTTSKYFKKYLQIAGVQLQRDLQANLAKVTETSETEKIKISFDINEQSQIKNFKVLQTSGSKEIDAIVEASLKNTLSYIKVPVIPSSENFVTLTLVINF